MTNEITIGQFKATPTALYIPGIINLANWAELGARLSDLKESQLWWLGDWYIYGEKFGEEASQFVDSLGYAYETMRNAAWVCRKWPPLARVYNNLTFSHYQAVSGLDGPLAASLLKLANDDLMSVTKLRALVNERQGKVSKPKEKTCPECGYSWR